MWVPTTSTAFFVALSKNISPIKLTAEFVEVNFEADPELTLALSGLIIPTEPNEAASNFDLRFGRTFFNSEVVRFIDSYVFK